MNAKTISKSMTKKGNALGFTAKGDTVCCQGRKDGSWKILCSVGHACSLDLADPRTQTFATKQQAAEYALSLIDPAKTEELKWW
jgi:hypothetical protein